MNPGDGVNDVWTEHMRVWIADIIANELKMCANIPKKSIAISLLRKSTSASQQNIDNENQ